MTLTVGVPGEVKNSEHRVAITPDGVRELVRARRRRARRAGRRRVVGHRRRRVPGGRGEDRAHGRGRVGGRAGLQGEGAAARGVRRSCATTSCSSPTSTSPPTRRSPTRCSTAGTAGVAYETVQLENGDAAPAGPDERGGRAHGHPDRRPLPRARERRPRRAARRRARRAARPGGGARRRQRRVELGVDRRGHGGRGAPARQEHRPPPLGRPDPPGPHHDAGLQPRRGRAGGGRGRPRDRRRARRRRPGADGRDRRDGRGHEARRGHRRRRRRPGRVHRDDPRDHPRRPRLRGARRPPLRGRQHPGRRAEHLDLRAHQRHPALPRSLSPTEGLAGAVARRSGAGPRASTPSPARSPTPRWPRPSAGRTRPLTDVL